MSVDFKRINYEALSSKQKENYNFQKVSGVLADYGFSTVRLTQDWQGADFIAQHADGMTFLKVQLKGRLYLSKKYIGKEIWTYFLDRENVYLFPHDQILDLILKGESGMKKTVSWETKGGYGWPQLPNWVKPFLEDYRLLAK